MSINSYIENLKQRPEHVRRRYAFWTSFGITAVIAVFWLSSFGVTGSQDGQIAKVIEKVETPAQSLTAAVGDFFVDVKDIVFGPKKIDYSVVEAVPGDR